MSGRDRIIAMALAVLVVVVGGWMLLVSPEREKASTLQSKVNAAQAEVSSAAGQLANARQAQSKYSAAYAAIVSLGKAVPATQEVPSLIYQLEQATNSKGVQFNSIASGAGTNASASATPAAAAAGFTQMPFTFVFSGGFSDLEHLFSQLTAFTNHDSSGGLAVSGRLLTVQSVKLAPAAVTGAGSAGASRAPQLTGTITASAYVLPAGAGLTAGATPASPSGSVPASSSSSSPTTPAIARVTP